MFDTGLIEIFRGDDTDGLGYQTINGVVDTDIDLTGCTLTFRYLDFTQTFTDVSSGDTLTITMSSSVTKTFPPGLGFASVRVTDSQGKLRTFNNRIPVIVKTSTPCVGGGSFHICFKKFPELEPLKIFTGGTSYTEYTGYVQRIIDKATATQYGLAMLYDGYDSAEGASTGKAASPAAVKAAYDAVIANLTDNYYTAQETEQAIDRLAAYYITSNASGDAFNTRAALVGATTYYSGGAVRVPTRNDYAVVLADETHSGAEWRYIYSGSQWEAQYPIETNDYAALSNKPSINGVTLVGNKTTADLGIVAGVTSVNGKTGAVTLTGADIPVSGSDATKVDAAIAAKYTKPANGIPASDLASGVIPTIGTTLAPSTSTAVTGGTIWSHIWGALTAIPDSAASLYAWITAKFAQYLPLSGGEMTGELVIPDSGNADISIGNTFNLGYESPSGVQFYRKNDAANHHLLIPISGIKTVATTDQIPTVPTNVSAFENDSGYITSYAITGKLDSVSAAPNYSAFTTYSAGDHVTYNGRLFVALQATSGNAPDTMQDTAYWKRTDMTSPDATLDVSSAGRISVYDANGNLLWTEGYDRETDSSTTPADRSVTKCVIPAALAYDSGTAYTAGQYVYSGTSLFKCILAAPAGTALAEGDYFTAATSVEVEVTMPSATTGKVCDFIVDIDNTANAGFAGSIALSGRGTSFVAFVAKGGSIGDATSAEAGGYARVAVSLTSLTSGGLPVYHVQKVAVEAAS